MLSLRVAEASKFYQRRRRLPICFTAPVSGFNPSFRRFAPFNQPGIMTRSLSRVASQALNQISETRPPLRAKVRFKPLQCLFEYLHIRFDDPSPNR